MEVLQTRVPKQTIDQIDSMVAQGNFSSRSDVVRHAIRMLVFQTMPKYDIKGDPVKMVRQIRKELNALPVEEYMALIHGVRK